MIGKLKITILIILFAAVQGWAQRDLKNIGGFGSGQNMGYGSTQAMGYGQTQQDSVPGYSDVHKKNVPSIIRTWKLTNYGANIEKTELDTALNFFHVYNPIFKRSISNTFTGNLGGAYLSNDFFSRKPQSDFYFYQSFDAYSLLPLEIQYFNTTTPYTLLDYSQSEKRNTRNETRFNVFHSQNVNKDFNFIFLYDQAKSTGHYQLQETKFHNIGLITSYNSDKYSSHFNLLFNRHQAQENGGLLPGQDLNKYKETETYLINLLNASSKINNSTLSFTNEYRLGKTEEKENEDGDIIETFRPITGIIHQVEYSGNSRNYSDSGTDMAFYLGANLDSLATADTVSYNRLTNVLQLKFYESANRKYTFSKRAYIGNDLITIKMPSLQDTLVTKTKYHNTFVGGAISRDEGRFWKWNAQGKFYLTGFRSGQTELSAYIHKPLKIGKDTTTLSVSGELNSIVPDYFIDEFTSNHYSWKNRFNNINEMIVRAKIQSQKYRTTVGLNYALISNYIFNNAEALPQQGGREMLVLAAYANKDFISRHWLIRTQVLWQKGNQEEYLHLPDFTGYLSFNYKTIIFKVLHTHLGFDIRYNTEFYADAYDPATGRYYWQNQQKIGNFPFVDLHANLKLKRTRIFFEWLNAAAGLLDGNFWSAPDYPLYRRTFRLGVAWSFYD